jgi:hypothetical protein
MMYQLSGGEGKPHPSPPFTILKTYGGPLGDDEYRTRYSIDTYKSNWNLFKMIPTGEVFEVTSKF